MSERTCINIELHKNGRVTSIWCCDIGIRERFSGGYEFYIIKPKCTDYDWVCPEDYDYIIMEDKRYDTNTEAGVLQLINDIKTELVLIKV